MLHRAPFSPGREETIASGRRAASFSMSSPPVFSSGHMRGSDRRSKLLIDRCRRLDLPSRRPFKLNKNSHERSTKQHGRHSINSIQGCDMSRLCVCQREAGQDDVSNERTKDYSAWCWCRYYLNSVRHRVGNHCWDSEGNIGVDYVTDIC